ncbi:fructosamine kinase family protein [Loigolactobacillus zhaoyuanensis]|uniref:fructosamine kinase family protein n=1 Tax=Loigolactobacillus zhaoyuanensis TaxID=2486017 RepID=UPI000F738D8F|nr:fructosamine kinase family protein [Loigolactobacillus zhaoyuanensis]
MLTRTWLAQLPLTKIKRVQPVSGGDINQAYCVQTERQRYFLKVQKQQTGAFFAHEQAGLELLAPAIRVPQIIASGTIAGDAYLLLEWLDFGSGDEAALGRAIAHVHQQHANQFGLAHDFTAGKLPKYNAWCNDWADFYINQRLAVLADLARRQQRWNDFREQQLQQLYQRIRTYFATVKPEPSLLHGDLWSGNSNFLTDGTPVLLDPDVFYGDREMDLAMTQLFGGFSAAFYQAYTEVYPLRANYQQRMPWYQTYYLMAHLNLFGETYGPALDQTLLQATI